MMSVRAPNSKRKLKVQKPKMVWTLLRAGVTGVPTFSSESCADGGRICRHCGWHVIRPYWHMPTESKCRIIRAKMYCHRKKYYSNITTRNEYYSNIIVLYIKFITLCYSMPVRLKRDVVVSGNFTQITFQFFHYLHVTSRLVFRSEWVNVGQRRKRTRLYAQCTTQHCNITCRGVHWLENIYNKALTTSVTL